MGTDYGAEVLRIVRNRKRPLCTRRVEFLASVLFLNVDQALLQTPTGSMRLVAPNRQHFVMLFRLEIVGLIQ